jgi:hypothetical protein
MTEELIIKVQENDKTFRACPECTIDPSQPYRVLASRWQAHVKGRKHRSCVRRLQGKAEAMSGPEVEAKRAERKQRKQEMRPPSSVSSNTDSSEE